jgi:transcriptional regulator with XRE-family HTH domain
VDKIKAFRFRNPDVLIQAIGQRLRMQRLAMGLTQVELAERAGISLSTLKLMEQRGKGSLQRLAKVAVVLGLDGDLRGLFSGRRSFESLDAVERSSRIRAPHRQSRKMGRGIAARVSEQLVKDNQDENGPGQSN